jgi:putative hydrolase of the HAD superfamily
MIKAVVFDFGRVISAMKPLSLFRTYESDLGLAPGRLNRIMFGLPMWDEVLVGRKTEEEFWSVIGPQLGLHGNEEIKKFRNRYRSDEAVNQGVVNLINRLKGRYKTAVLSNAPPGLKKWLAEWELLDLFDYVYCSGDQGIAKPDSRAFTITLEQLGVKPQEAVFIDDTLRHVEAAGRMGLVGIHFTSSDALEDELRKIISLDF